MGRKRTRFKKNGKPFKNCNFPKQTNTPQKKCIDRCIMIIKEVDHIYPDKNKEILEKEYYNISLQLGFTNRRLFPIEMRYNT